MQVFIFRSEKDSNIVGFTAQRDGGNLPAEFAPWTAQGNSAIQSGAASSSGGADAVQQGIKYDGYFLTTFEVSATYRPPPRGGA
jgi:hypothetical protein